MSPASFPSSSPQNGCQRGAEHTALKWGRDGELSDLDLQRILARLTAVDPAAETLNDHFSTLHAG
ncbi:MAG: hypothetical protein FJ050_05085 [Cyanobacteria bacterium M_surface_7_m2_040]|nr:hypothetical protein [Cyanobacteria bacterium K_Offshore_0m_m2_072]MBM5827416.1 hypothetical protein [Cyanobacteria bacterium M_surface_7_m2_040]